MDEPLWQRLLAYAWNIWWLLGLPMLVLLVLALLITRSPLVAVPVALVWPVAFLAWALKQEGPKPLPITVQGAQSPFTREGFEFVSHRGFLKQRQRSQSSWGQLSIELLGDRKDPPHLVAAEMSVGAEAEPTGRASALEAWYRLADAVATDIDIQTYLEAEARTIHGARNWFAARVGRPSIHRVDDRWEFSQADWSLNRQEPEGTHLSFTVRRPPDQSLRLRMETTFVNNSAW